MNSIRIRLLNEKGLLKMEEFLSSFAAGEGRPLSDIWSILKGPDITEHAPNVVMADSDLMFRRRYDLAEYLHELIPSLGLPDPTRDKGLWAWLALLWFDQFAPLEKGKRKVGKQAKWIPEIGTGWRYYRHFVLGPYMVYGAHRDEPERSLVLLSEPVHVSTSEIYRMFVESPVLACKAAVDVASKLYYDDKKGVLKRGAGVKGPGGARRLLNVLMQIDRTFDLYSMSVVELDGLLPKEFARFKVEVPLGSRSTMVTG